MKDIEEDEELGIGLPLSQFPYDKFELDKSEILELFSQLPEKICEQRMEQFIESFRVIYSLCAGDLAQKEGRVYTHEEVKAMFHIKRD